MARNDFNTANTELKKARDTIQERDGQLETLQKSTGDITTLKETIATLQEANKTQAEQHAAEIKQLRFDNALTAALTGAKARNPETVKPLLKAFLETAEMDGESIKSRLT